jgi:NAD(P)-dependent dehydrogenase (short-subunit alcohol dehydrogenase family)
VGEITVSVVGSKDPNWFDTHQIPKNAAYAIPDEAATRLMTASLDVTDPTAATRVVSDAVDHFGRIDVLVNNAGDGLITAFEEMSPEQIHQQFATNVYGVMNVTRAVLQSCDASAAGTCSRSLRWVCYLGGSRVGDPLREIACLHQGAERTTVGFTLAFNRNTFCGS